MTNNDAMLADVLNGLIPLPDETGNWERVLADAGLKAHRRVVRRRTASVATALVLAALVPITAVAVNQGWWFFAAGAPPAKSPVIVMERITIGESQWALTAYLSTDRQLCVGLTRSPGAPLGPAQAGSGQNCTRVDANNAVTGTHFVQLGPTRSATGDEAPEIVFGSVPSTATTVEIALADGTSVTTTTASAPAELGVAAGFFVTPIPSGEQASTLTVLDSNGSPLAVAALADLQVSTPGSRGISWGGSK